MKLIAFDAAAEAATGLFLVLDSSLVVWLLFGTALTGVGPTLARLAGFCLVALGVACWPMRAPAGSVESALRGLVTWNALAAILFLFLAVRGEFVGLLLWPALILHAGFAAIFARMLAREHQQRVL